MGTIMSSSASSSSYASSSSSASGGEAYSYAYSTTTPPASWFWPFRGSSNKGDASHSHASCPPPHGPHMEGQPPFAPPPPGCPPMEGQPPGPLPHNPSARHVSQWGFTPSSSPDSPQGTGGEKGKGSVNDPGYSYHYDSHAQGGSQPPQQGPPPYTSTSATTGEPNHPYNTRSAHASARSGHPSNAPPDGFPPGHQRPLPHPHVGGMASASASSSSSSSSKGKSVSSSQSQYTTPEGTFYSYDYEESPGPKKQ